MAGWRDGYMIFIFNEREFLLQFQGSLAGKRVVLKVHFLRLQTDENGRSSQDEELLGEIHTSEIRIIDEHEEVPYINGA
jgi:GT2 family glycosyltransferase